MRNTHLAWNTKKGSYILETSIALPIFLIGVLALSSIIGIVSRIENENFILCDEAERYQFTFFTGDVEERIMKEAKVKNVDVARSGYTFRLNSEIGPKSVMDINSQVSFNEVLYARPFIGTVRKRQRANNLGIHETYRAVFVFPNSGQKYHKRNCTYVNSYPSRVKLTKAIRAKYRSCSICKSKEANLGDMVYLFEYGRDYHLRNCKSIDKYVIEMDEGDAKSRGYTPCSKCGG